MIFYKDIGNSLQISPKAETGTRKRKCTPLPGYLQLWSRLHRAHGRIRMMSFFRKDNMIVSRLHPRLRLDPERKMYITS
jgi:hypothetical protein